MDSETVLRTGERQKTRIVGIAGGSASGKSTFTAGLTDVLREARPGIEVSIISADAYYTRDVDNGPSLVLSTTGERIFDFNHPDAIDQARLVRDIARLGEGSEAPDVILIEGLMVLHIPEIRELLDIKIFIELDADIRAVRRILRDMSGGRRSTDPQFIAAYYLECARVGHEKYVEPSRIYADLILRGDADFSRVAAMISRVVIA